MREKGTHGCRVKEAVCRRSRSQGQASDKTTSGREGATFSKSFIKVAIQQATPQRFLMGDYRVDFIALCGHGTRSSFF